MCGSLPPSVEADDSRPRARAAGLARVDATLRSRDRWIDAVTVGTLPNISLSAALDTLKREARVRFSNALTVRPLGLRVVRDAARVYYDDLVAAGYAAAEIESTGREEMMAALSGDLSTTTQSWQLFE